MTLFLLTLLLLLTFVALRERPREDAQLLVQRGMARLQRDQPQRALEDFRRAAHLNPRDATALRGMARAFHQLGHLDSAVAVHERIVEVAATRSLLQRREDWWELARACWRADDFPRAIPALQAMHGESVSTLQGDLQLALYSLLSADRVAAQHIAADMLDRYGRNETVWRLRMAVSDTSIHEWDRELLELLVGWRATDLPYQKLRAKLLASSEPRSSAEVVHAVLAESALGEGRHAEAESDLLLLKSPTYASLRAFGRTRVALARGEAAQALQVLEDTRDDPSVPVEMVEYLRGWAHWTAGNTDAARTALQDASRAAPTSSRSDLLLGNLEESAGRHQAAMAAYRRVLDIDPGQPDALFQLGAIRTNLGDFEQGRGYLAMYLRDHPQGVHAANARSYLRNRPGVQR